MLIVFCIIGAAMLGAGIFLYEKWSSQHHQAYQEVKEYAYCFLNTVGAGTLIISIIAMICVGIMYSPCMTIDEKIEIYKNENSKIEQQMSVIVDDYMGYESETFEKFKDKDSVSIVSLFPELKSNKLVAK